MQTLQNIILVLRGSDGQNHYFFKGQAYGTDEEAWLEDIFDEVINEFNEELDGSGIDHLLALLDTDVLSQAAFDALPVDTQRFILSWFYGIDLGPNSL